jgi:hypothetical protein
VSKKLSAEARRRGIDKRQYIDAIVKARCWFLSDRKFTASQPPGWAATKERDFRERLERLSVDELRLEALRLSLRRGELVGPSPFEQESTLHAVAQKGNEKSVRTRQQRRRDRIERGRRLLAERPKLRADQLYDLLQLKDEIERSTFDRHDLPKIRRTLAG